MAPRRHGGRRVSRNLGYLEPNRANPSREVQVDVEAETVRLDTELRRRRDSQMSPDTGAPSLPVVNDAPSGSASDTGRSQATNALASVVAPPSQDLADAAAARQIGDVATGPGASGLAPDTGEPDRRPLENSMLAILREEAEREARSRRADASLLEMHGDAVAAVIPDHAQPTSVLARRRSELLPTIDDVSSTLAPTAADEAARAAAHHAARQQSLAGYRAGFRQGFLSVMVVAMSALALYLYSPDIMRQMPSTRPVLVGYMGKVNTLRHWLDGKAEAVTEWLSATDTAARE